MSNGFDSDANCVVRHRFTRLQNRLLDDFCFGNRDGASTIFVSGSAIFFTRAKTLALDAGITQLLFIVYQHPQPQFNCE